jgi:hypothetical protein
MTMHKRVEVIQETDSRFILLRIDRYLLMLVIVVLAFIAAVHTFGIVTSIKSDDELVRETEQLRKEVDNAQRIINSANEINEASVEFWRCAFLIEPDVKKTPQVIDTCIEQADFPER